MSEKANIGALRISNQIGLYSPDCELLWVVYKPEQLICGL